jgi:hypothetical protein
MKLIESVAGTVIMADGTGRLAYRNTYRDIRFSADGATFTTEEVVRVEFALFTNANAGRTRKFRKTTPKQAATFHPGGRAVE